MKKLILPALALLCGALFLFMKAKSDAALNLAPANISCNINQSTCALNSVNSDINATLSIKPKPIKTMSETSFVFSGLSKLKAPSVRIYGLNMDLGVVNAALLKNGAFYSANIMLAACTQKVMTYRLDVLDDERVVASIDFNVFE